MKYVVAQIGAREHYAIARALQARGQLAQLYTDVWSRLGGRFHPDIPSAKITAFTGATLMRRLCSAKPRSTEAGFLRHASIGQDFALRVNRSLAEHLKQGDIFFSYNTGCLETLPLVRGLGAKSVVDQIDPARVEQEIVLEECARFPNWQALPGKIPEPYYARLQQEWALADQVVVNSAWSREALIKQGVPAAKITVIPLAYEAPNLEGRMPSVPAGPKPFLRVLFLGQIILRKGVQYLFEAARLLERENIAVTLAGPLGISAEALKSMPRNMRYIGRVSREKTSALYLSHDVFVLPTLSDGFALTQLEAMAHGLPVIATPCCGEVVQDNKNGFIIPARDAQALAQAILKFRNKEVLATHATAAKLRAQDFSLENLASFILSPHFTPSFISP